MCGYCGEISLLLNILEPESKIDDVEYHNNVLICLQESENFPEIINKLKFLNASPDSVALTFCRIWEKLLFQKYDKRYQSVISGLDDKSINFFLTSIGDNSGHRAFEPLADKRLYADSNYWQQFISNKNKLIEASLVVLNDYYHFWLAGENREVSGQGDNVTTAEDSKRFYLQFPSVYFSFLLICKYQNNANMLKKIALQSPYSLPDLTANDLWLQRKAFTVCVKRYGLPFIFDNYNNIRFELIYYSLSKKAFCSSDLELLKNYIQENDRFSDGVTPEQIIKLITYLQTTLMT